jgi:hypothetical protein
MVPGMQYAAIAQPLTSDSFTGQVSGRLHLDIPLSFPRDAEFNLSTDTGCTLTSPNHNGYMPFSTSAGFASFMSPVSRSLGFALPHNTDGSQQTWSQSSSPQTTSPEPSSGMGSPFEVRSQCGMPPIAPPRHPAHTLNAGILPIISAAIPNFQNPTPDMTDEEFSSEEWENEWTRYQQEWLQLEGQESTPPLTIPLRLQLLKWNRVLHIPRNMVGRKLAGKWNDDEMKGKIEEIATVKSVKTAPSIL